MQVRGEVILDSPNKSGAIQHLDTSLYQKFLYGYNRVSIDWSSKELNAIETYLTLIDQCRGIVKSSVPIGAAVRSVS